MSDPLIVLAAFVLGYFVGLNFRDSVDWLLISVRRMNRG